MMTVSLCVVAFNEEDFLPNLLQDLKNQTYPHERTEIVLVGFTQKVLVSLQSILTI